MSRACSVGLAAAALVALAAREAHASPRARLVYGRGEGADACGDEAALRRAVAARVGYDPFFPWAPKTVIATIAARGDHLVARVQIVDGDARAEGARDIDAPTMDCAALFDTLALSISIAIDPRALARPPGALPESSAPRAEPAAAPAPPPAPRVALVPPSAAPRDAPPAAPTASRWSARAWIDGHLAVGAQPSAAPGVAIGGGAAWRFASVGLEALAELPTSADAPAGGRVRAWRAAGSLVPCAHLGIARVCGVASVGRIEASGSGVPSPRTESALFIAFGARAGVELPLTERVAFAAHVDVLVDAAPVTVRVGEVAAWSTSALTGALAMGAVARF